jgi:hypothetical protein
MAMTPHRDQVGTGTNRRLPPSSLTFLLVLLPLISSLVVALIGGGGRVSIGIQVSVYSLSVFALIAIALIRRRYLNDLGWLFIIFANMFWFAFPAFSQLFIAGHWYGDWIDMDIPNAALTKASALIPLFLAMNAVGYFAFRGKIHATVSPPTSFLIPRRHRVPLVATLFLGGLVPYLLFGGSLVQVIQGILLGRADKAWSTSAANVVEVDGVMTIFWLSRAFLVTATSLAGIYLLMQTRKRFFSTVVFGGILSLGLLIVYYDQGTRSYLAMTVVPVMTLWILRRAFRESRFQPGRLVALGVAFGFVLLALTQFQAAWRTDYSRAKMGDQSFSEIVNPQQHIDFYTETANAIVVRDKFLTQPLYESAIYYFAINPIPRILWSGKPVAQTQWHYTMYRWGVDIFDKGGNALPSIVGQYYMNFNTAGVVWIGLLFGLITAVLERLFHRAADRTEYMVAVVSAFTFMFLSYRYLAPSFHYTTLLLFLIVIFYRGHAKKRMRTSGRGTSAKQLGWGYHDSVTAPMRRLEKRV